MSVGFDSGTAMKLVQFPPRNETFAFRQQLETAYQVQLRRAPVSTFVDTEGSIVWTQEYLRYRLSGCSHAQAAESVLLQIDRAPASPDCGANVPFPPRNEPYAFRAVTLESKYRDGLHRVAAQSFVDLDGDIVWTTEYLRYRVSGCDHPTATQFVLMQVNNAPPSVGCGVLAQPSTPVNVGFIELGAHDSPFRVYGESGVTVVATSGDWTVSRNYGHPAPFIQFRRPAAAEAMAAEIKVVADGAAFTFSAVDVYSSITPIPYEFTGLRNFVTVFRGSGTVPNTFGNFATVQNPSSREVIDALVIRLTNPTTSSCCSNPMGLDNIVVFR